MSDELASSPAFLAVLDASYDPFGIVDADGRYIWINEASVRLFGYPRWEVLGTHARDRLLPHELVIDNMERAFPGTAASAVRRLVCRDGSILVLLTELIPLGGGCVLIHATDLTDIYEIARS